MNEPKNCPFCGEPAEKLEGVELGYDYPLYGCIEPDCPCYEIPFVDLDTWNSRAVEDELLARIAELEQIADMLELTGDMLTINPECSDIDKREQAWNNAVKNWNEYKRRRLSALWTR